jgi:hypothetical protein
MRSNLCRCARTATVVMKFCLAFGAPGFNMMLASWLASFVLTCELNSVAITTAAHALADGTFDTSRCLHVITNIDIMADNINDRWEQAQVLVILGAAYGVYSECRPSIPPPFSHFSGTEKLLWINQPAWSPCSCKAMIAFTTYFCCSFKRFSQPLCEPPLLHCLMSDLVCTVSNLTCLRPPRDRV